MHITSSERGDGRDQLLLPIFLVERSLESVGNDLVNRRMGGMTGGYRTKSEGLELPSLYEWTVPVATVSSSRD